MVKEGKAVVIFGDEVSHAGEEVVIFHELFS